MKMSFQQFLRKPRSILANAGFYLNLSIFTPHFKESAWTVPGERIGSGIERCGSSP